MALVATSSSVLYRLDRLRRFLVAWFVHSANALLYVGLVLTIGIASALYLIDTGTRLTTWHNGPWTMWFHTGQLGSDPYTRARLAKIGALPLSSSVAATWEARYDADGRRLHSSCEYVIESEAISATWFNIAVYDDQGLLISNQADRYSFSSQTLATSPDGSFFISLARDARPGNWLPVGGAGRLSLLMTIIEPQPTVADSITQLPTIRRVDCR
ncbi:MAG: DUF1214 domain-containing protein [Hyphomicrobiaceae bacterium]